MPINPSWPLGVVIAGLEGQIQEIEKDLEEAPIKLTNVRARLVLAAHPVPVVRAAYPNTSIDPAGKSAYEWLTAVHQEYIADLRQDLARLRSELIIRHDLPGAIPNPDVFLSYVNEHRLDWTSVLPLLRALRALTTNDEADQKSSI